MRKSYLLILFLSMLFFKNTYAIYEKKFYEYEINGIDGKKIQLRDYKGKTVLLVNTASYCGFTKQYEGLQKLWEKYKNRGLIVLGVPSNSFNQEKDSNNEIKKFCEINFNITFPLTEETSVKGKDAHEIFKWAKKNHGNTAVPKWNFHKILINKEGKVQNTYNSFTKPNSNKIVSEIEKIL